MGSFKPFKTVRLGSIPLIRRNPDRHAKRIGYQKTKKELTTLKGKKSTPKIEPVKISSPKIEPVKKSPSLKVTCSEKTRLDAPEAPKMPYVERKFFKTF